MTSSVPAAAERVAARVVGVVLLTHASAWGAGDARGDTASAKPAPAYPTLPPRGAYYRLLGGAGIGRGIRFNNPFRLSTQLGDGPESLSATSSYLDAWVGATTGRPSGLQHGLAVHGSFSLGLVVQEVVTPGYLVWWQPLPSLALAGRAALPIVIRPDANLGYEIGVGVVYWLGASIGVTGEIVGDLFYGAGTPDTGATAIPIVSMQLGAAYQYEVLP
jgi:hypothetical protein